MYIHKQWLKISCARSYIIIRTYELNGQQMGAIIASSECTLQSLSSTADWSMTTYEFRELPFLMPEPAEKPSLHIALSIL